MCSARRVTRRGGLPGCRYDRISVFRYRVSVGLRDRGSGLEGGPASQDHGQLRSSAGGAGVPRGAPDVVAVAAPVMTPHRTPRR